MRFSADMTSFYSLPTPALGGAEAWPYVIYYAPY